MRYLPALPTYGYYYYTASRRSARRSSSTKPYKAWTLRRCGAGESVCKVSRKGLVGRYATPTMLGA